MNSVYTHQIKSCHSRECGNPIYWKIISPYFLGIDSHVRSPQTPLKMGAKKNHISRSFPRSQVLPGNNHFLIFRLKQK